MLTRGSMALLSFVAAGACGGLFAIVACSQAPETNFGNPVGLRRDNLPGEGGTESLICANADAGGSADGGCNVSWSRDIFPNVKAEGPWKCADATKCHGGVQSPKIDTTSASAAYASLKDWKIPGSTNPYINTAGGGDPTKSTIECNLQSQCGQGMPESPGRALTHDEICQVDAWLRCGAPNN